MMKTLLATVMIAALSQIAWSAEMQTIVYPDKENPSFLISAPEDWEMKQAEDVGDYFHLTGPSGAVFSFRTIKGTEASLKDAIEDAMKEVAESYKDPEMGDAEDWTPNGLKGFYATGTAVDKQDNEKVRIGMGWCMLDDGKIAEFWFVGELGDTDGLNTASAIANSLKAP